IGVPVDLPQTAAPPITDPKEPLVISIDGAGEIFIEDAVIQTEGLVPRLQAITDNNPDALLYVRADKSIDYGRVLEVMSLVSSAGFPKAPRTAQPPHGAAQRIAGAAPAARGPRTKH